jgi:hypothetical protein
MTDASYMTERKGFVNGYVFGAPVHKLGAFASLLSGLASGVIAFFFGTFLGIVGILVWNGMGHAADFSMSYRLVGLPLGILVLVVALSYLGTFWVKRVFRKQ